MDPEKPLTKEEKEYEAAWDAPEPAAPAPEGDSPPAGDPSKPSDEAGNTGTPPAPAPDPAAEPPKPVVDPHHGEPGSVAKALQDTKSKLTRVEQDNAELRRKVAQFEAGRATAEEVAQAREAVGKSRQEFADAKARAQKIREEVSAVAEDYPEFQGPLGKMVDFMEEMAGEVDGFRAIRQASEAERARASAITDFETNIKPKILPTHPDFDQIVKDPKSGYFDWAEKQSPGIRYSAMESNDPNDIIWALTQFKKFRGSEQAEDLRSQQDEERRRRMEGAASMRGGAQGIPRENRAGDAGDYNAAWDGADAILKKQGIL